MLQKERENQSQINGKMEKRERKSEVKNTEILIIRQAKLSNRGKKRLTV